MRHGGLTARDLRTDTVYVSPRGLLVRLVPAERNQLGQHGQLAYHFAYVGRFRGDRTEPEGFWLTEFNLCILRPGVET